MTAPVRQPCGDHDTVTGARTGTLNTHLGKENPSFITLKETYRTPHTLRMLLVCLVLEFPTVEGDKRYDRLPLRDVASVSGRRRSKGGQGWDPGDMVTIRVKHRRDSNLR